MRLSEAEAEALNKTLVTGLDLEIRKKLRPEPLVAGPLSLSSPHREHHPGNHWRGYDGWEKKKKKERKQKR